MKIINRLFRSIFIKFVPLNISNYDNTEDFLFLHRSYSVKNLIHQQTIILLILSGAFLSATILLLQKILAVSPLLIFSAIVSFLYLFVSLFKLFITFVSLKEKFITISKEDLKLINESDLPLITVLIPLYNEFLVVPQIFNSMTKIDYPVEKLEFIITLEEYDQKTIEAIKYANFPNHFKTLILPNVKPKTKPKALNVAFHHVRGEYLVIYDAEVIPEPSQLKKAYVTFKNNPHIGSLQTRLDHYNSQQNLITKLFSSEFSYYYDLFLPGLQKLNIPIPLSGHSVFFRTSAIKMVGAWDPYNVAEDCDIGIRLQRVGVKIGILDSISCEEATSTIPAWIRQRTRWMKGFIQTSVVHLRHPLAFKRELGGGMRFLGFILIVPGTVVINLFNFCYWVMLIAWFIFQPNTIQKFFPGFILYLSFFAFLIGNFIFTYLSLLGAHKRHRYGIVKYTLLTPIYWLFLSIATIRALLQIIFKPHHWEKTSHGSHLRKAVI